MPASRPPWMFRWLPIVAGLLVLRVLAHIASGYGAYFPADFQSEFLRGREGHFLGLYRLGFYAHIVSGPVSLLLVLVLLSARLRRMAPGWHRRLGWVQVGVVVLLVSPSGLVMARHAAAGAWGGWAWRRSPWRRRLAPCWAFARGSRDGSPVIVGG